jgi:Rrf2 family nitric oxide-sensitive transcriptional repressor
MKLTSFTDHSLRALIYLAAAPGRRATIAEVASAYHLSESHMMKVVHFLGLCGWLANSRGKGGGVELGMAPGQILVGQVVRATEGTALPAECFGLKPSDCAIARVCELKGVLKLAVDAFYQVLDQYTLEDLTSNRQALAGVLNIHPVALNA